MPDDPWGASKCSPPLRDLIAFFAAAMAIFAVCALLIYGFWGLVVWIIFKAVTGH